MPVIGSFHNRYWKARANVVEAAGVSSTWHYSRWQTVPRSAVTFGMAIWGVPFEAIRPVWDQIRWSWRLMNRLWIWRSPAKRAALEAWIGRLEQFDTEETLILERVVQAFRSPYWSSAREKVRACANTPKFHQPEQWVEYGRAIKADAGQAQNVYRHVRVVHELKQGSPITNPEAHLIAELAYQGMAALPSRPRVIVSHPVVA